MTFVKHSILLTALFILLPIFARLLINRTNRRAGTAAVPIDLPFLFQAVLLGILFPIAADGGFVLFSQIGIPGEVPRYLSLGLVGTLYGWFFGLQPYVYTVPAIMLGFGGGLLTALLYTLLPFNLLTLALFAAVLTVLPLLAIEFPEGPVGRIIQAGQSLLPIRGYLR